MAKLELAENFRSFNQLLGCPNRVAKTFENQNANIALCEVATYETIEGDKLVNKLAKKATTGL